MNRDGIPLPSALSGNVIERLVRIDEALLFLVTGALAELADDWRFEETGALTSEGAKDAISAMLWCFMRECSVVAIGTIQMWLTATPPDRWLILNGQAVSRVDYAGLFDLWGETFGAGDGSTTFNMPDMRSLHPKGAGGVIGLGEVNGASVVTLSVGQLPAHSHVVNDPGHVHRERVSTGVNANVFTSGGGGNSTVGSAATVGTTALNTGSATTGITIADEGLGDSIDTKQPSIGVHYIVYAGA